jgi:DNA adenine methylase
MTTTTVDGPRHSSFLDADDKQPGVSTVTKNLPVAQRLLTQPLKYHGGKFYLAKKLIAMMPQHLHYVEPFFGGGSVLLARDPARDWMGNGKLKSHEKGCSEVVNDVNGSLMNFWAVIADPVAFIEFERLVNLKPFAQAAWETAAAHVAPQPELDIDAAVAFFLCNRLSRQGLSKDFATLSRNRTRVCMNEQAASFLGAVAGLQDVAERLRSVVVLCDDACKVIRQQDGEHTLIYADPPYPHSTRSVKAAYAFEMNDADHVRLLDTIQRCKSKVMVSGYRNPMYDRALASWQRHDIEIDNKASSAATKRKMVECVWTNY